MRGFDGERAYELVLDQCALGPRIAGSSGNARCRELIATALQSAGWPVETDGFTYRRAPCCNLLSRPSTEGPAILLGAHFDTRPRADRERSWWRRRQPVPGANDGASGVAVLLELARVLSPPPRGVWLAFFDAEDRGRLDGWPFCVGSSRMAASIKPTPDAVVVADMVGGAAARFFFERSSHPGLSRTVWQVASDLGLDGTFVSEPRHAVWDDHTPFLQRGIPSVDIVDLDYPHWHRVTDTPGNVAAGTLGRVGLVLETLVRTGAWQVRGDRGPWPVARGPSSAGRDCGLPGSARVWPDTLPLTWCCSQPGVLSGHGPRGTGRAGYRPSCTSKPAAVHRSGLSWSSGAGVTKS